MLIDLPIVPAEIPVRVGDTGVVQYLAPLSDEEYYRITAAAEYEYAPNAGGEERAVVAVRYKLDAEPALYQTKIRRIEGASFGGQPFDPASEDHQRSVPGVWKPGALMELIAYKSGRLGEDDRGNSNGPAAGSPTGSPAPAD
jgi:hypothetical protein